MLVDKVIELVSSLIIFSVVEISLFELDSGVCDVVAFNVLNASVLVNFGDVEGNLVEVSTEKQSWLSLAFFLKFLFVFCSQQKHFRKNQTCQ